MQCGILNEHCCIALSGMSGAPISLDAFQSQGSGGTAASSAGLGISQQSDFDFVGVSASVWLRCMHDMDITSKIYVMPEPVGCAGPHHDAEGEEINFNF